MRSPAIATRRSPSKTPKYSPNSIVRVSNGPGLVSSASAHICGTCSRRSGTASSVASSAGAAAPVQPITSIRASRSSVHPSGTAPDHSEQ